MTNISIHVRTRIFKSKNGYVRMDPPTGFWQITPSDEFRSGGPLKQNLTSHVGPTNLAMFISAHYAGEDTVKFADGEPWKRVFGPVFMYLNGLPKGFDWNWLWEDAKELLFTETDSWPYSFPASEDFPTSDQRGNLSGRLLDYDSYSDEDYTPADVAYVGLAFLTEVNSWQLQSKAISEKNKKNAAQRKVPYYGSRGGYRGIEKKV